MNAINVCVKFPDFKRKDVSFEGATLAFGLGFGVGTGDVETTFDPTAAKITKFCSVVLACPFSSIQLTVTVWLPAFREFGGSQLHFPF